MNVNEPNPPKVTDHLAAMAAASSRHKDIQVTPQGKITLPDGVVRYVTKFEGQQLDHETMLSEEQIERVKQNVSLILEDAAAKETFTNSADVTKWTITKQEDASLKLTSYKDSETPFQETSIKLHDLIDKIKTTIQLGVAPHESPSSLVVSEGKSPAAELHDPVAIPVHPGAEEDELIGFAAMESSITRQAGNEEEIQGARHGRSRSTSSVDTSIDDDDIDFKEALLEAYGRAPAKSLSRTRKEAVTKKEAKKQIEIDYNVERESFRLPDGTEFAASRSAFRHATPEECGRLLSAVWEKEKLGSLFASQRPSAFSINGDASGQQLALNFTDYKGIVTSVLFDAPKDVKIVAFTLNKINSTWNTIATTVKFLFAEIAYFRNRWEAESPGFKDLFYQRKVVDLFAENAAKFAARVQKGLRNAELWETNPTKAAKIEQRNQLKSAAQGVRDQQKQLELRERAAKIKAWEARKAKGEESGVNPFLKYRERVVAELKEQLGNLHNSVDVRMRGNSNAEALETKIGLGLHKDEHKKIIDEEIGKFQELQLAYFRKQNKLQYFAFMTRSQDGKELEERERKAAFIENPIRKAKEAAEIERMELYKKYKISE